MNQAFTPALKQAKGLELTELQDKAELLWTIFFSTSSELNLDNIAEYKYSELIFMPSITEAELTEIIMRASGNKASGLDGISNWILH